MKYSTSVGKNKKIIKHVFFTLFMLLVFLIENTGRLFPAPLGIHAVLLMPAVISVAMFEREFTGLFYGLFAGALLDAFSAKTMCFHAVAFTLTGFAAGALITYLLRNNLLCCIALSFICSLLYNSVYFFCFVLFSGETETVAVYFKYYFLSAVYTAAVSPVFYLIIRKLSKVFR